MNFCPSKSKTSEVHLREEESWPFFVLKGVEEGGRVCLAGLGAGRGACEGGGKLRRWTIPLT